MPKVNGPLHVNSVFFAGINFSVSTAARMSECLRANCGNNFLPCAISCVETQTKCVVIQLVISSAQ